MSIRTCSCRICHLSPQKLRSRRGLLQRLGADEFAAHLTDYYLAEHPAEHERVGRERVLAAVRDAVEWGRADSRHPQGLL